MKRKVRLTFTEHILGTCSANPEIHAAFIASKAPDALSLEEEVAAIGADEVERKEMSVFARDEEGRPFVWDYWVKGFFKGTCGFLRRVPGTKAAGIKSYKKVLDGLMFIHPRKIYLQLPDGAEIYNVQRPLRAETLRGERVALANSEAAPAGTVIEFEIESLTKEVDAFAEEALDYGVLSGMGQWRNSGAGRFTWEDAG